MLSFEQAMAGALAAVNAPKAKARRMKVGEAMDRYFEAKDAAGQATRDGRLRSAAHILPALGDKIVAELRAEQLRRWLADLAAAPARRKGGRKLPVLTDDESIRRRRANANRILTLLKAALNFCFDEGYVPTNAAWGRKLKAFRGVNGVRIRYLTVAESVRLINAANPPELPIRLGADVPRHPGAARTKRWEAMVAFLKKHPKATLEQVIANTPYTRGDYRLDLARGAIKA